MSPRRPAAAPPWRGRPSAELVPPATGPDPGEVRSRLAGPGASSGADDAPPVDLRRPTVPADGSPSIRASSGTFRKHHRQSAPGASAPSSTTPSDLSREALEYELARAHERLAVLRAVVTFEPSPRTGFGNGTVQDADGRSQGPQDIHAAHAPRSWCLSKDLAQGSTPEGDLVFTGNYVELELRQAAAPRTALTALSRVSSSRPAWGRSFRGPFSLAAPGWQSLSASAFSAVRVPATFTSAPAARRSVRAGSTLLHVGRFRRRDLWDMSDGYLGVWGDRRGAVVSATLDAYQASQQGVRRPSAPSCSRVPRPSFFDGDPDVPRRGASDRGTGEPGKHWIGRDADDDPFISTPGEETVDAASRRRVRFR